jgi:hypothetical protein
VPSRVLHDSFLSSPSVRACSPAAQDALPRFILLADDFGCFEAAPRVLLGRGWPYRDDVTEAHIRGWLVEYSIAGMLRIWEHGGRWWGCLVNWWKFQRAREEYSQSRPKGSKRKTPPPPNAQGDVRGFAAGRVPVDVIEAFPGGKPAPELSVVTQTSAPLQPQHTLFPPGNAGVPGEFPLPQSQSQSQSKSKESTRSDSSPTPPSYPEAFAAFWSAYPRREGKHAAFVRWKDLVDEGVPESDLGRAAKHYAEHMAKVGRATEHMKHASTFLSEKDQFWRDYVASAPEVKLTQSRPAPAPPSSPYAKLTPESTT